MLAWRWDHSTTPPVFRCEQVAAPEPGRGELLVKVFAAGVTPSEAAWYPTTHTAAGAARTYAVPGHELAGVVAAKGAEARGFAEGDEIFGMNDWFADGATAEYCVTRPEWVFRKPRRLSFAEAASAPIGALTAWQGLFERARLQSGETVLVHGASGGVGVFAVQVARWRGARVVATASATNAEFLMTLGAERVIDYRAEKFEVLVQDIDVVFDGVGGATLERSWGVLAPGGRLVTIAAESEGASDERTKRAFFIVEPKQQQLAEIAKLLESRAIRAVVDAEVPFSEADLAYAREIPKRLGRGKLVVKVSG
jgi:NADPH:quinone reductase-like Zn-dependent oxidoreductase